MSFVWRYLTKPEGVSTADIAKSTGKPNKEVLAELRGLERQGKVKRLQVRVGKPHLWWKTERYPLCGLTTVLVLASAADIHQSKGTLRSVMQSLATRTTSPALGRILQLASTAGDPHEVVKETVLSDEVADMLLIKYED